MTDKRTKKNMYRDVHDYYRKISDLERDIAQMKAERRRGAFIGGSILDHELYAFELKKQHTLAQAHSLARRQGKMHIVERLLKSAAKADFLSQRRDPYNPIPKIGYHKLKDWQKKGSVLGGMALAAGVLTGTAELAAIGAIAIGIALVAHNKAKKLSAHYDLNKLKSYVRSGRL